MKSLSTVVLLSVVHGVFGSALPSAVLAQGDPTHVLELTAGDAPEPARADVWLTIEEETATLTVVMPGGDSVVTECVLTEQNEIKFQLSRVAGDRIANIQFIGAGSVTEGFEGTFTAMVDGEQRPDMSGVFALTPG